MARLIAWPGDKPITMIIAYSPGGGTDLVARAVAPYLEKTREAEAGFRQLYKEMPWGDK